MRIVVECRGTNDYQTWIAYASGRDFGPGGMYATITSAIDDVYQLMCNTNGVAWWYLVVFGQRDVAVSSEVLVTDTVLYESSSRAEIYHMLKAHLQMMRGEEP